MNQFEKLVDELDGETLDALKFESKLDQLHNLTDEQISALGKMTTAEVLTAVKMFGNQTQPQTESSENEQSGGWFSRFRSKIVAEEKKIAQGLRTAVIWWGVITLTLQYVTLTYDPKFSFIPQAGAFFWLWLAFWATIDTALPKLDLEELLKNKYVLASFIIGSAGVLLAAIFRS